MNSLDNATRNDFLLISKSLVPYLNPSTQKPAAIFIKALELMYTIEIFSKEDFVRGFSRSHDEGWEKNFLRDIRKDLSDERGYFIDALLKLSEAREILSSRSTDSTSSSTSNVPVEDISNQSFENTNSQTTNNSAKQPLNSADFINNLSGLLEPNQLGLLKVLSSFMK